MPFKAGDRVRILDGQYEGYPATSQYNLPKNGVIKEVGNGYVILIFGNNWVSPPITLSSIIPAEEVGRPVSPIVTRAVLVEGEYNKFYVTPDEKDSVLIGIAESHRRFSIDELRAASKMFIEIADYLEGIE